ncbi:MAG: tRNA adenosine(34) deaminase TadA [Collinsella sp.]|nr:tRNA adenosine(34) deaminase TadA [Collinsella sp.]
MADDECFMREALAEARLAADLGEVPIGAVVVHEGEIIARAHNLREVKDDPSAHAEFSALLAAARALGRWRLSGCTVYVTLEPCTMCAGLMVNARVDRCVYGAPDPKGGALGTLFDLSSDPRLNHSFEVVPGVLREECASLLRSFFADLRARRSAEAPSTGLSHESEHLRKRDEARSVPRPPAPTQRRAAPRAPHVLLAIDSFKGSLTSERAERSVAEGIRRAAPDAHISCMPLADGGEGTVLAMDAVLDGELVEARVDDPFGDEVAASYLLTSDGVAVMEMASAAGIAFSERTHDAALRASSAGVGQLLLDAVEAGARTVYLGLGGSATSDGGAGLLTSLGARLLDGDGRPIAPGLAGLGSLASVDLAPALERLEGVELIAWTDVDNPLVGRRGAVRVFGPQKGLADLPTPRGDRPTLFDQLDAWMAGFATQLDRARTAWDETHPGSRARRFRFVAGVPGAGSAGGLGAAMLALGARLTSGATAMLDLLDFDELAREADLVITGEGMIDGQSARGKAPVAVASRAKRLGRPVIAVVGGRSYDLDPVYDAGVDLVLPILREPMGIDRAMRPDEAHRNLVCAGEAAIRAHLLSRG